MNIKRLLILITRSEPGGAQSHVLELLIGLSKNYKLIFATGEEGFLLDHSRALGLESYFLPSLKRKISPITDYRAYKEIRTLIQQVKPDLIHTHSSKAGILGRFSAHQEGIKNIFTAHGWAFANGTPWTRKWFSIPTEFIAGKWCDRIITVSHADKRLAMKYRIANQDKITVIHNGIADVKHSLVANPVHELAIITMVARIAPPKNFKCLFDALSKIDEKYLLRIVGDGPDLAQIKKYAIELGIEKKIEYMGSRNDVAEILASSDIFVLSSDWEGFPISIIEAMRAGLPIISSDVGGIPETITEGRNGYLIPRGDADKMSIAIKNLLVDVQKREKMGKYNRNLFVKRGTAAIMLEEIEKVYGSLLSGEEIE